jgi:hypothetical protein
MAFEVVLAEENAHQHASLGVVGGLEVENDRNVRLDASDVDGKGGR